MIFTEIQSAILSEPELDAALELARIYGNLLWFADVGIYDASELEQELISRCTATPNRVVVDVDAVVRGSVIHVVTEPYVTGGHTRLMEKLAGMHESPVDLLITKRASKAALDRVSTYFKSVTQISLCTPLEQVFETTEVLSRYEKIVLHIHPDDIYTVVACGLLNRRAEQKIFFVNHADHVFSFGCSVADYYFELSSYGRRLDALKKIKGVKSFLGIPIDVPEKRYEPAKVHLNSEILHFITAASDIKFKPVKNLSLTVLLNRILTEYPNCKVSVIGSNIKTAYWWWLLKVKYKNRFSVIPIMPHSEYLATMQGADFFVDSYPIPGGTAFAEQFVSGRRCVGLVSPLQGYSPADRLKRATVDQVMNSIVDYKFSTEIYDQIVKVNSTANVESRYLRCLEEGIICPNLLDSYCDWNGDVGFFRQKDDALAVDVSTSAYFALKKLNSRLAMKLIFNLRFDKKLKLLLKILLVKYKNTRLFRSDAI